MKILEHNVETGEVIERNMTKEETAQHETDAAATKAKLDIVQANASAKAALLLKLGLTADEANLLLK